MAITPSNTALLGIKYCTYLALSETLTRELNAHITGASGKLCLMDANSAANAHRLANQYSYNTVITNTITT